jgi:hypothetical protein
MRRRAFRLNRKPMTAPFEQPTETVKTLPERKPDEFRAWAASRRRSIGGWLGHYADRLRAVATDPALPIDLDGHHHRKAQPNENFARERLELFTLGEGHSTEDDVRAAARALSGWRLDPVSGVARFNPQQHDRLQLRYPVVKLLDYRGRDVELEAGQNPFAVMTLH